MKRQRFNSQQLGLFSKVLMDKLFPKPLKGELLIGENFDDGSHYFYFTDNFHKKLDESIREKYFAGEFANSNSEAKWIEFMNAINSAQITDVDISNFQPHPFSVDPEEDEMSKINVNLNELERILATPKKRNGVHIFDIIEDLQKDAKKIYEGHEFMYNFFGWFTIKRTIIKNSPFPTALELKPLFQLFEKYEVQIESMKVKANTNTTIIYIEFTLK